MCCVIVVCVQIEHHLFPAISFMHYPAISNIIRDEAHKRGLLYNEWPTLPQILGKFVQYMKEVGTAEQVNRNPTDLSPAMMSRL